MTYVPQFMKLSYWTLVYSNWRDGRSINTYLNTNNIYICHNVLSIFILLYLSLYGNCEDHFPCIIIIHDMDDCKYGAYCTDSIKLSTSFYGNGECFLFKFKNNEKIEVIYKINSYLNRFIGTKFYIL